MHVTTIVAAAISLAGAIVVLRWMPGLSRPTAPEPVEVITEGTPVAVAAEAVPVPAAVQVAPPVGLEPALDAATGPRGIDPIEALDVWQENLSARSASGE
jgi:hypothetical protein